MITTPSGNVDFLNIISSLPSNLIVSITLLLSILGLMFKIGKVSERFDKLCEEFKEFKDDFKIVDRRVTSVVTILTTKFGVDGGLFSSRSPLVLKEKGWELLEKSGFKRMYSENKDFFLDHFKIKGPKTKAEVDKLSTELMLNLPNKEMLEKLRQASFDNGVSLPLLLQVCAIFLRDEIIKELGKELVLS